MKTLAVMGAGPAGLMAAWAGLQAGYRPTIFDKDGVGSAKRMYEGRVNAGVFLLHEHCDLPVLNPADTRTVRYSVLGQSGQPLDEWYSDKVYGPRQFVEPSYRQYRSARQEFDGLQALRLLIDICGGFIRQETLTRDHIRTLLDSHDRVVCTVPLVALQPELVTWRSARVWVYNAESRPEEAYVMYAPTPALPWYRASAVFGRFTLEYPELYQPTSEQVERGIRLVTKPVAPPKAAQEWMQIKMHESGQRLLFLGRFGEWRKGVEQHDVYGRALKWLMA